MAHEQQLDALQEKRHADPPFYLLFLHAPCSPRVEFCGYSNPHPSENKIHLRVQMYGKLVIHTQHTRTPLQKQLVLAGRDEKKGSYVPINLPGCFRA